jgi:hypothetical protein
MIEQLKKQKFRQHKFAKNAFSIFIRKFKISRRNDITIIRSLNSFRFSIKSQFQNIENQN